jgi:hypothetical protein
MVTKPITETTNGITKKLGEDAALSTLKVGVAIN